MKTMTICYGNEYMTLREDGCIARPAIRMGFSGQWKVTGAVERNNFGHVVRRYSLEDIFNKIVPWKFANGKQRTFVTDFDHGTMREWRTPHSIG